VLLIERHVLQLACVGIDTHVQLCINYWYAVPDNRADIDAIINNFLQGPGRRHALVRGFYGYTANANSYFDQIRHCSLLFIFGLFSQTFRSIVFFKLIIYAYTSFNFK